MTKFRALYVSLLASILCIAIYATPSHAQFACLPTCDLADGEFLALAAMGLSTSNNRNAEFQITSASISETFEIGIFDGDGSGTNWDVNNEPFVVLEYSLYADPEGNGTGNSFLVARWSSNGAFGDNIGEPMPTDEWFTRVLSNIPQARTADGTYSYRLEMENLNPDAVGLNGYKVRTDGAIFIPAGAAFNYVAPPRAQKDFETLFPNIDITDPACFDMNRPGGFCDPFTDPSCCLNPTLYTGEWSFCFMVPDDLDTLDIWDGDFDFGSASFDDQGNCIVPDNVNLDTDDQNTPIPLPDWAIGTDAITQSASIPTDPADDNFCNPLSTRPPSVIYNLVGPGGVSYMNTNPSGNIEWELFNISTLPFDPNLYDIHVDDIPGGLWCVETFGNDMQNLNSLRLPFAAIGVDDNGEPVVEPPVDLPIPSLNQWGVLALAVILGIVGFMAIRRKKVAA